MKKNYLKYISALILFGLNGIVASSIALSSYEIVMLRTFIGSILLLILFLSMKNKFTFYKHKKSFVFLIISGIAMGASWMFLYEAYQEIGVSLASIEYYCEPVIVMILSPIIFKEKLTYKKILGFICVVAGILLVDGQEIGNIDKKFGIFCGAMFSELSSE
ncbi:DMT family transporter [Clostridium sp. MSJ-8]|uniref:EamA family transporter n=1 Tax=Clostridium sp. MSJ-8 TaxID=2841510 RepID=UPI001C0EF21A|nr:DMT family transporter [Clostridium sp. MSJ-8]MBU5486917.1 DMT family transporter [Clostridium sp. MSJ-8]